MKAVVQRVTRARSARRRDRAGLCVLLGVARGDTAADAERLAGKIARLRIFENDEGKFDRSLLDTGGAALVVSQFTLLADTAKGNRPSFSEAAPPDEAEPVYEAFCAALRELGVEVGDRSLRRADGGRARQRRPGDDRSGAGSGFGLTLSLPRRPLLSCKHHISCCLRNGRAAPISCVGRSFGSRSTKGSES